MSGEIAMVEAMKAKKMAKSLSQLVGNESDLPLAGTIVDNLKGALSGGFSQIAGTLPATIPAGVTAANAIVSIKGKTNVPITIVSKTKNELDLKNATVTTGGTITKSDYKNGFQITGAAGADWYARYVQVRAMLKPNTQYTLSAKGQTTDEDNVTSGVIIYEARATTNTLGDARYTNSPTVTFTTTATGEIDMRFYLMNGSSVTVPNPITSYYDIMIVEGATASLPYVDYLKESYTIQPIQSSFSQIVNIIPNAVISNPEGTVNSFTSVQIAVASSVQAINGESPDENGNIDLIIPKSPIQGKKGVMFGDSMIEFGTIPEQIANLTGATIYDCSVGGTRMSTHPSPDYDKFCMSRLVDAIKNNNYTAQDTANANLIANQSDNNTINLNNLKSINWNEIDFVSISYGTNDFGGLVPLGDATTTDTFIWSIEYSLKTLLTKYPHLKIYLFTPVWRWNWGGAMNDSDVSANANGLFLKDYCAKILEVAKKYHVPALDLYNNSGISLLNKDYYISDGTHPTTKGYELLAEKKAKFLTAM